MNKIHKYKSKYGLDIIYVHKENFNTSYCGIGTKFGGSNLKFKCDNKDYILKPGTAHFLEHQLFKLANGEDAVKLFSNMYTINNAYTQENKTIYYIKTTASIYKPLELLLEMYFNASFVKEFIENEKQIIKSEMNMYDDNPGYRILSEVNNLTYPNDFISIPIIGTIDSINDISLDDIKLAYDMFYTPSNSALCIVSKENPNKVFTYIENILSKFEFKNNNVYKYPIIKSTNVLPSKIIKEDIYQKEVYISLRFDTINNIDPISCDKLLILLDSLFNVTANFYQYLYNKELFINDIDFEVHTLSDTSHATIHAVTDKSNELINEIISKIKNLSMADIDRTITTLNIKHLLSDMILESDDVQRLGDKILSFQLEDIEYDLVEDKIANLTIDDIYTYVDYVKNSKISYLIVEPKNE